MAGKRLYSLNENYFEKIDSEDKAYWLGFIFADGCISVNQGVERIFAIRLSIQDKLHLEKLKVYIETNKPIGVYKNKPNRFTSNPDYFCDLNISSKKIVNNLKALGCVRNKSLILQFPQIEENLVHHFIRGYFDGDGSVYSYKQKAGKYKGRQYPQVYKRCGITIIGTKEFLTGIYDNLKFLKTATAPIYKERRSKENTYSFQLSGFDRVSKFRDYIYKDATVFLDRKFEKFQEFFN